MIAVRLILAVASLMKYVIQINKEKGNVTKDKTAK